MLLVGRQAVGAHVNVQSEMQRSLAVGQWVRLEIMFQPVRFRLAREALTHPR